LIERVGSKNNKESAQLYAAFAKVAAQNPQAWNYGKPAETEESIGRVTKRNRMICFPYPLLMNAFNTVNLAATCLLTSTEDAKELGIPESKWIYPLAGADTRDSNDFWKRSNYHSSPAISQSPGRVLTIARPEQRSARPF
jgi:acetyl-CoA acetyltransferase